MSKPTKHFNQLDSEIAEVRKEMDTSEAFFIKGIYKIPSEEHLYYACLSVKHYRLKLKKEIDNRKFVAPIDYNYKIDEKQLRN